MQKDDMSQIARAFTTLLNGIEKSHVAFRSHGAKISSSVYTAKLGGVIQAGKTEAAKMPSTIEVAKSPAAMEAAKAVAETAKIPPVYGTSGGLCSIFEAFEVIGKCIGSFSVKKEREQALKDVFEGLQVYVDIFCKAQGKTFKKKTKKSNKG